MLGQSMQLLGIFLFTLLPFTEATNKTLNDSKCILADIESHLSIASQIIETAKEKLSKDLKELCGNINDVECECKNKTHYTKPADCSDIYMEGERRDGLYDIWLQGPASKGPVTVYCDMESNGGGWTVIQRRGDYGTPEDYFYRDWNAYKQGFGDMLEDFWIGNDNLFGITNQRHYQLRVNLTAWDGNTTYATYGKFRISDENHSYTLDVKVYNGTAGDSLKKSHGSSFTTIDKNNNYGEYNCASIYNGAWWFTFSKTYSCTDSCLNGFYFRGENIYQRYGIMWETFKGPIYSLREAVMKIRPVDFRATSGSGKYFK